MKKTFSTSLAVILVTVLAFVCITKPLQARADSASMDYVETDMSTSEVKALFSGSAAFIPAAIMIIGFIVMCYCVLRNVEVPLDFADQTSFSDKLTQLGQYAIDNAGDSIKDFLYSVYTYCNDNGITSIWGLSKFIGLQAGKFFGAITSWIGGSLINNPTDVGNGLINSFLPTFNFSIPYSSVSVSQFNSNSVIPVSSALTFVQYRSSYYQYVQGVYLNQLPSDCYVVFFSNGVGFYRLNGTTLSLASDLTNTFLISSNYSYNSPSDVSWSTSNIFSIAGFTVNQYSISYTGSSPYGFLSSYGMSFDSFKSLFSIYYTTTGSVRPSLSISELVLNPDLLNPAVDNVYVPTDVWNIDLVGTWEQIRDAIDGLNTQTERIAAFVGNIPLTLTAADSYAPTINDAGNYVFPDMTDIWKYPQYFFDTLKGWGSFVGNCLRAVTVGEGGLSWIFYGGFVLLVCGGIIGKILMG